MQKTPWEKSPHVGDDQLDMYSMKTMPEEAAANVEEHLLACAGCQERLGPVAVARVE